MFNSNIVDLEMAINKSTLNKDFFTSDRFGLVHLGVSLLTSMEILILWLDENDSLFEFDESEKKGWLIFSRHYYERRNIFINLAKEYISTGEINESDFRYMKSSVYWAIESLLSIFSSDPNEGFDTFTYLIGAHFSKEFFYVADYINCIVYKKLATLNSEEKVTEKKYKDLEKEYLKKIDIHFKEKEDLIEMEARLKEKKNNRLLLDDYDQMMFSAFALFTYELVNTELKNKFNIINHIK